MQSVSGVCKKCGAPLRTGAATCTNCGASVGTLFTETPALPQADRKRKPQKISPEVSMYHMIEEAHSNANKSLAMGLISFFVPIAGALLGLIGVWFGIKALKIMRAYNVDQGRGAAIAGVIVGIIGLLAQLCYGIYISKVGLPF